MPKTRPQPPRLTIRMTRRRLLNACVGFCAMGVAACHSDHGVAPLPPGDGLLTGTWIQPSIDTWVQLDLSQSGGVVVGYFRTGSANFGLSDPIAITGTAALPRATLQWTQNEIQTTMNATLSGDGDSLTGTWSVPGQPATPFFRFQRTTR